MLLPATLNTPEYCPQLTLYRAVTNGLQTLPDFPGFVTVKWTETASMKLHVVQVPALSHVETQQGQFISGLSRNWFQNQVH